MPRRGARLCASKMATMGECANAAAPGLDARRQAMRRHSASGVPDPGCWDPARALTLMRMLVRTAPLSDLHHDMAPGATPGGHVSWSWRPSGSWKANAWPGATPAGTATWYCCTGVATSTAAGCAGEVAGLREHGHRRRNRRRRNRRRRNRRRPEPPPPASPPAPASPPGRPGASRGDRRRPQRPTARAAPHSSSPLPPTPSCETRRRARARCGRRTRRGGRRLGSALAARSSQSCRRSRRTASSTSSASRCTPRT